MKNDSDIHIHLPHSVFDSHFHALHMSTKGLHAGTLLKELFSSGLNGALEVAVDEKNFPERLQLAGEFPGLFLSAGIHPSATGGEHGEWNLRFSQIRKQLRNPAVRAIGETGLDFFREHSPVEEQERAFRDHLNLASETGLPIIVHNREADDAVLKLIRESGCRRGIFHCFSSGLKTAEAAMELGFHISFAGNITYRKSDEIRKAAGIIPADRILIETDSPYLSPQKVRGKTNHPGHIGYTLEFLAEIRGERAEDLARNTAENARSLFSPGESD
jgi:TatD DNase family protein